MKHSLNWTRLAVGTLMLCGAAQVAPASIISDFNSGDIIVDFTFDDLAGTDIPGAVNSADPSLTFDSDGDSADVVTNGLGQLDASGKANTSFGSNYIDLERIESGRVIALYEVEWAFDETVFSPTQDEEFRLGLMGNNPRGTTITAEIAFFRTSLTEVELSGRAFGDGVDTSTLEVGSSGSLLTILDANLDTATFELFVSADGGATFAAPLTGSLDPDRPIESLRIVLNEDFSDDTLLIDRVAVSVIPEPSVLLLLFSGAGLVLAGRRNHPA